MSEIATYTFLPWLREGIANQINGQEGSRATIPIDLLIKGKKTDGGGDQTATISKEIQIYGPGDITGIDGKAIIKVEPRDWITNFEPNYLPFIDLYEEDLPWRYSPMPNPGDHRLQPWLALVVLKESEFKNGKIIKDRPLPYIKLESGAQLPNASQSWAWAHVHINKNLIDDEFISEETDIIASRLEALLDENADQAYSRIVCPRRLEEKEAYHAFLVPVFESGRLAGIGENPEAVAFDALAWEEGSITDLELPYYHRWYFRTGTVGDFEYLVRLLEPKPVDSRVGLRDMDVQQPGANLRGVRDEPTTPEEEKLHGILKLGGALKVPDSYYTPEEFEEVEKYRNWANPEDPSLYPHRFQKNLGKFINLTDSYEEKTAQIVNASSGIEQELEASDTATEYDIRRNPDPLITAPLYGRWHALTQRLLKKRDNTSPVIPDNNWIHELNLDPRWRVASGFGTKVVQENQEDYMKAAWEQVGDIIEANRKVREGQFAQTASQVWYETYLRPLKEKRPNKWLSLSAPVHNRVVSNGLTVFYQQRESKLTRATTSVKMRQLLRPRGKFAKRLPFDENTNLDNLISRINTGEVSAAPEKTTPSGIQTVKDVADTVKPNVPNFVLDLLESSPWIKWVILLLALIILLILIIFSPSTLVISLGVTAVGGLLYLFRLVSKWSKKLEVSNSILEENQTPESVDDIPNSPDFRISEPGENYTPSQGSVDSEEGKRFKRALKDAYSTVQQSARLGIKEERPSLDIATVNEAVFQNLDPKFSIPRWVFNGIRIPPYILIQQKEIFEEAMAYPKFDLPMYKPLADHSAELFLPNINFIEQNSISILETNQKFIEAYMVGLNHEFARELLWREYPTDQRGSYFRQFWEVSGFLDDQTLGVEPLKARYKKILDERNMPELKEYYDRLLDPAEPKNAAFLSEAHVLILKEELKDIKPLHYWSKTSKLGDHDNRELPGDTEEEVVLVIRGELLKKYPTAVIYAHRAAWNYKLDDDENEVLDEFGDKIIDPTRERSLAIIPEGMEDNPPKDLVKSPLYEAKVDPDIYFFGFDITICEAQGGTGKEDDPVDPICEDEVNWDDPGWFFVIKERPGEPRFGLDVGGGTNIESGKIELWNDLGWNDLTPAVAEGAFIQISETPLEITADQELEGDDLEKGDQQDEDKKIKWTHEMNAAELAYILYQVPVLVAVHATEMLPNTP